MNNSKQDIDLIAEAERLINFGNNIYTMQEPKKQTVAKKTSNLNFWLNTSLILVGLLIVALLMQF